MQKRGNWDNCVGALPGAHCVMVVTVWWWWPASRHCHSPGKNSNWWWWGGHCGGGGAQLALSQTPLPTQPPLLDCSTVITLFTIYNVRHWLLLSIRLTGVLTARVPGGHWQAVPTTQETPARKVKVSKSSVSPHISCPSSAIQQSHGMEQMSQSDQTSNTECKLNGKFDPMSSFLFIKYRVKIQQSQ